MDIIHIKENNYKLYEQLIFKRDEIKKEIDQYILAYYQEFGDSIVRNYQIKIECIEKKKTINYCQKMININQKIIQSQLEIFVTQQMSSYYEQLDILLEQNEISKTSTTLDILTVKQIKTLYRKLAKLIHPDMNSQYQSNNIFEDLWNRIVFAYKCNDLKSLQELEVLVYKALSDDESEMIVIENIEEKIEAIKEEINNLKESKEYKYKYILEDLEEIEEKHMLLDEEYEEYKKYLEYLVSLISTFDISEVVS